MTASDRFFITSLFIILDGKASLSGTNNDGDKVSVGVLEVGDFFGEIALFTSNSSSFKVMAITDITVITISPPKVLELVENNSKFAYYLDEIMDIRRDIKNKKSYQES
jgi:CRP-like cAMP-binding protein